MNTYTILKAVDDIALPPNTQVIIKIELNDKILVDVTGMNATPMQQKEAMIRHIFKIKFREYLLPIIPNEYPKTSADADSKYITYGFKFALIEVIPL